MQNRIKEVRKAMHLTQIEFGNKLGVKGNTITTYETGARIPSEAVVVAICREFNVNYDWLRTGEGEMFRPISRNDELAQFFGDVLAGEPDSFRARLITVLARMSEEEWALVECKARELFEDAKKGGP